MATIVAAAGAAGNWTVGATWVGGVAPTAADDAQIAALTTSITIDSGAVCRSADFTGFTGTVTHNAVNLTIGDGTAGLGNVALTLVAGMTYTLVNAATSAIVFASTSGTTQTVNFAGKTTGNVNFSTAGVWQLTGTHVQGSTATFTHTAGTLDTNGQTCTWGQFSSSNSNTRTLTLGASAITVLAGTSSAWNCNVTTNQTVNANTSVITLQGSASQFRNSPGGGTAKTYYDVSFTGAGQNEMRGAGTFTNLRFLGTAVKTDVAFFTTGVTVTGILELAGNSSINRLLVRAQTLGTAITITNSGATMTWSNADFQDITLGTSFNASAITGLSGDGGGNTNITFTGAQTNYWIGGTGNWSAVAEWASSSGGASSSGRVPLPQDSIRFDASSFSAGSQTVTGDMPRSGGSIDWTGATNSPTWAVSTVTSFYGSITLISGMTFTQSVGLDFMGRGSHTITSAGQTWSGTSGTIAFNGVGSTYTLQDAFTKGVNANTTSLNYGTLDANGFTITINGSGSFNNTNVGTNTRALDLGSATLVLAQTGGTILNLSTTNFTLTSTGSTISITDTGATTKTFIGGGNSYGALSISGGGAGSVDFTGANTFASLPQITGGTKTIRFTAATTTSFTGGTSFGNGANLITISSITAATHTLSMAAGTVAGTSLSLTNSIATGGAAWYAGATPPSVDNGGNTGWIFTAAPAGGSVKTLNGLAYASVKTQNGLAVASVKTYNGVATQ